MSKMRMSIKNTLVVTNSVFPSLVVTGKICSEAKNGLTNALKLVNIFGWLG